VDLVVLAHTQTVELAGLRAAIEAKRLLSGLAPFDHIGIPEEWHRTYPATAKGVPTAETYSAEAAGRLVARFIDPALAEDADNVTWNPQNLAWSTFPSVPRAYPAP